MVQLMFLALSHVVLPTAFSSESLQAIDRVTKKGQEYRIEKDSEKIHVYTTTVSDSAPSSLILKFKSKKGIWNRVHLSAHENKEGEAHYSGLIPAGVTFKAGLKFDIDFPKK